MTERRLALGLALACVLAVVWVVYPRDPVHGQWKDRASLPSCGEITLSHGEAVADLDDPEVACLRQALTSGHGAELVVHYPTDEGDPLTDYLRVTPAGTTEIYTDSTHDEFSDGKWSYGECAHPTSAFDSVC